jgi:MoaA/NifB/PqqE/SkfB family radical SAM enzyme
MPSTIGNLTRTTLKEMLSSDLAQKIRQSIIDGSYVYCNEKLCGVITNHALNSIDTVPPNITALLGDASKFEMPHHISFQGDETCNLSCPSCRTSVKKTPPEKLQEQQHIGKLISENLFSEPTDQRIKLELSGTGEVFASPLLLNFINSIDPSNFPNLELDIGTNGLLCQQNWHRLGLMQSSVKKVTVSIDASQASTYEKLRRGGQWKNLLESMNFLQNKKHSQGMALHTRMIVQQQNYPEIESFYQMCQQFDVDIVEYSRVTNWGTWSQKEFQFHDVVNPAHAEYKIAQAEIDKVKKLSGTWFAGL